MSRKQWDLVVDGSEPIGWMDGIGYCGYVQTPFILAAERRHTIQYTDIKGKVGQTRDRRLISYSCDCSRLAGSLPPLVWRTLRSSQRSLTLLMFMFVTLQIGQPIFV